jgi:hypothetical protein
VTESSAMDDWLSRAADALAGASGVTRESLELDPATEATLLDLARVAAHDSGARTNAPLLAYLIGRTGLDPERAQELLPEAD